MSIYKKPNSGYWWVSVMHNGKRYRVSTKTTDRKAALAFEKQLIAGLLNGKQQPEPCRSMTLRQGFDKAIHTHWKHGRNLKSSITNASHVCEVLGNDLPLKEIRSSHLLKLVEAFCDRGCARATINRKLACLSTMLHLAHDTWEELQSVPSFRRIKFPEPPKRFFVYSTEQRQQLVHALRNAPTFFSGRNFKVQKYADVADLIEVLADTGMRLGESLKLKTRDINFKDELIHVWENKADYPRSIPMTQKVMAILSCRQQMKSPFGHLSTHAVESIFKRVKKRLGWAHETEMRLHALRHTTASMLVRKGVNPVVIQIWLGHKSEQTTRRYMHLAPANLMEARDVLQRD